MKFIILLLLFLSPYICFSQTAKDYLILGVNKKLDFDIDGALENFNKAIELDKKLYAAYWNRGNIKFINSDFKGAMEDFNTAIELDPKLDVAYAGRAKTKFSLQDYRGAIKDYDKVIQLSPNISIYFFLRAEAKDQLDEFESAISDYDRSIKLNPIKSLNGKSYFNRGIDKLKINKKDEGCLDLSKAGELGKVDAYKYIQMYCQ